MSLECQFNRLAPSTAAARPCTCSSSGLASAAGPAAPPCPASKPLHAKPPQCDALHVFTAFSAATQSGSHSYGLALHVQYPLFVPLRRRCRDQSCNIRCFKYKQQHAACSTSGSRHSRLCTTSLPRCHAFACKVITYLSAALAFFLGYFPAFPACRRSPMQLKDCDAGFKELSSEMTVACGRQA